MKLRIEARVISILALLALTPTLFAETDFTVPPGRAAGPTTVTLGPDHNLWFTENSGLNIGTITPAGVITEYPIRGAQALTGIASGPDGNIWFTDEFSAKIETINTHGGGLRIFSLGFNGSNGRGKMPWNSHPQGITAGPDGNLWFVDQAEGRAGGFAIGKITTAGKITEYSTGIDPGIFDPEDYSPAQITTGPDGNLWFTNPQVGGHGQNFVGKITTSGAVTIYSTADTPIAITSGPDGNLWVTENSHVAKITTAGSESEYALTSTGYSGITPGPDGNIWFTELRRIGYVTPGGVVKEFRRALVANFRVLSSITAGSDGALWFLGNLTSNIGRFTTSGQLTNTYALNVGSGTGADTPGPDGAVWFTGNYDDLIGRVDTTGVVTTFPTAPGAQPAFIVTGPDGNLWFTEEGADKVASMTTSGVITEYPVSALLWSITVGPDGNLWFPERYYTPGKQDLIGRLTTSGVLTEFPIPTPDASPLYITPGPDGNLWFTENNTQQVAKIDPTSGLITEFPFPGSGIGLAAIVTGPDGNLWIMGNTEYGVIAKFSTAGTVLAEYPAEFTTLLDIKVGSDGALWFPQLYPNGVGRITTSGVVSTVPLTAPNALGNDVAIGADGKLWVAEVNAGAIGRMSAIGGTGNTIHAIHGKRSDGAVASFVDGTPTATSVDFTATISWGDNTKSPGAVSGPTGGPFTVRGGHNYARAGTYTFTVTLHDNVDNATYQASPGTAQVR